MGRKVVIDNPCDASWDKMQKNDAGRQCGICNTTVVDFTKMSLNDIDDYFKNQHNQKICGKYHVRHVQSEKPNAWHELLNKIENRFSSGVLKKLALGLINILLFISCKSKQKTDSLTGRLYFTERPGNKTENLVFPPKGH